MKTSLVVLTAIAMATSTAACAGNALPEQGSVSDRFAVGSEALAITTSSELSLSGSYNVRYEVKDTVTEARFDAEGVARGTDAAAVAAFFAKVDSIVRAKAIADLEARVTANQDKGRAYVELALLTTEAPAPRSAGDLHPTLWQYGPYAVCFYARWAAGQDVVGAGDDCRTEWFGK